MVAQRNYNIDAELVLCEDDTTIAADDVPQSGGVDIVKDVGAARFEGVAIIPVESIEIADNNELYRVIIQGCASADFSASVQNLAILELGATEVRLGGAIDSTVGRYELPFCTEVNETVYRYIRMYVDVAGTIAVGIKFGECYVAVKY